jgi:hypothetical protein
VRAWFGAAADDGDAEAEADEDVEDLKGALADAGPVDVLDAPDGDR